MKALDAFKDVQHEMDKFASPTFEVTQFNYFFNSAIEQYLTENYSLYDVAQKDVDDIRVLVTTTSALAVTSGRRALPGDYRHALKVRMAGTFNKKVGRFANGAAVTFNKVERKLSMEEGYRDDNHFLRANHRSPYYELEGSDIILDAGPDVNIATVTIQYIKNPPIIFLSPDPDADFNEEGNNTTIPFPTHVYYEIVRKCARIFIENIESTRYPVKVQEQQMSAE